MSRNQHQSNRRPGEVPHFPDDRQRHACSRINRQNRRERARGRLVDADAERHELECRGDDAVERLEDNRLDERRTAIAEQPLQRDVDLEHRERVKEEVEREYAPQSPRMSPENRRASVRAAASRSRQRGRAPRRGSHVPRIARNATAPPTTIAAARTQSQ